LNSNPDTERSDSFSRTTEKGEGEEWWDRGPLRDILHRQRVVGNSPSEMRRVPSRKSTTKREGGRRWRMEWQLNAQNSERKIVSLSGNGPARKKKQKKTSKQTPT